MTWKVRSLSAVCCLFLTAEAYAVWTFHPVKPKIDKIDDGMVRFVAVRTPPSNDAQLDRIARLTISDGEQTIIEISVEPTKNDRGNLIYEFKVAEKFLPHTKLEIFEKEKDKKRVLGGGDIYGYSTNHPYLHDSKEPIKIESDKPGT